MQDLILASASPRRLELLASLGLSFRVETCAPFDEAAVLEAAYAGYKGRAGEATPLEQLAEAKGRELAERYPDALVLSADTEVFIDRSLEHCAAPLDAPQPMTGESQASDLQIRPLLREHLGKPADRSAAIAMLKLLSGRVHQVDTAVVLQQASSGLLLRGTESTLLRFRELSEAEIIDYVDREHPYDKAGGYAVQEIGDSFVAEMQGEYSNVVGLPLELTRGLLSAAGDYLEYLSSS